MILRLSNAKKPCLSGKRFDGLIEGWFFLAFCRLLPAFCGLAVFFCRSSGLKVFGGLAGFGGLGGFGGNGRRIKKSFGRYRGKAPKELSRIDFSAQGNYTKKDGPEGNPFPLKRAFFEASSF
jgi:hypothetical protein